MIPVVVWVLGGSASGAITASWVEQPPTASLELGLLTVSLEVGMLVDSLASGLLTASLEDFALS